MVLVGTQLGQTLLIGHRHRSAWVAVGGTAAAMAVLVQTPGISQLFGCRPLGPVGWATAIGAATTATAAQLVAPSLPLRLVNLRRGGYHDGVTIFAIPDAGGLDRLQSHLGNSTATWGMDIDVCQ